MHGDAQECYQTWMTIAECQDYIQLGHAIPVSAVDAQN